MNQKMYIATWDTQIVLKTKRYSHYEIKILSKDASFNIDEYSVRNTLKCGWYVQQISALYILLNRSYSWIKLYILLHEIRKYFLRQSHIDVEKSRFWQRIHHSILMTMLSLSHWNVSDKVHKYQLCTSNLTVPTHESNYVYRYLRFTNSFSYKAIFTLDKRDFEHRCIIQYR